VTNWKDDRRGPALTRGELKELPFDEPGQNGRRGENQQDRQLFGNGIASPRLRATCSMRQRRTRRQQAVYPRCGWVLPRESAQEQEPPINRTPDTGIEWYTEWIHAGPGRFRERRRH
jgi:hypothetical protein